MIFLLIFKSFLYALGYSGTAHFRCPSILCTLLIFIIIIMPINSGVYPRGVPLCCQDVCTKNITTFSHTCTRIDTTCPWDVDTFTLHPLPIDQHLYTYTYTFTYHQIIPHFNSHVLTFITISVQINTPYLDVHYTLYDKSLQTRFANQGDRYPFNRLHNWQKKKNNLFQNNCTQYLL